MHSTFDPMVSICPPQVDQIPEANYAFITKIKKISNYKSYCLNQREVTERTYIVIKHLPRLLTSISYQTKKGYIMLKSKKKTNIQRYKNNQIQELANYNTLYMMLKWLFPKKAKRSFSFTFFFKETNL